MTRTTLTIATLALGLLAGALRAGEADARIWSVQWTGNGITDLRLVQVGERIADGFAVSTDINVPWAADTSRLRVGADGRLAGTIRFLDSPDLIALNTVRIREKKTDAVQAPPGPGTEVQLDLAVAGGVVTGTASVEKPERTWSQLGWQVKSAPVQGRIAAPLPGAPVLVEIMPQGVGGGAVELATGTGWGYALRLHVDKGRIEQAFIFSLWQNEATREAAEMVGLTLVDGERLVAKLPLKYPRGGKNPPVEGELILDGRIIDDIGVGQGTWKTAAGEERFAFRARVSRATVRTGFSAAGRTWEPQGAPLAADAALASRAAQEALVPIRPGEPGRQPFYSLRPIHLGKFFALHAPTIPFDEVPGAARYRITVKAPKPDGPKGSWTCELARPWMPLTPIWQDVPPGSWAVTATALDAAGKELGQASVAGKRYGYIGGDPTKFTNGKRLWVLGKEPGVPRGGFQAVPIRRMPTFAGPYWKPHRDPRTVALAAARAVRDEQDTLFLRGVMTLGGFTGGDGGANTHLATFARACALVAALTEDPVERQEALNLGTRIAWRMYLEHKGRLPTVYKGNAALMLWIGLAYLDLHAVSKDGRFREAALDLAQALAANQSEVDGAWPGKDRYGNHIWPGGVFGPSEVRGNGGEAVLWYLGRVRRELGATDVLPVEAKADAWVKATSLPEMFWQNVGYHSGEMVPVQDTVAPHALAYAIWMLDYAEGPARDLKLAAEIARWSEERHVDWGRDAAPASPVARPSCWGWGRAAGNGIRIAGSLAYVCARLAQETGDDLWRAKSQSLLQGILVAQDPLTGGLPGNLRRESGDTVGTHIYEIIETATRLVDLSRLLAAQQR